MGVKKAAAGSRHRKPGRPGRAAKISLKNGVQSEAKKRGTVQVASSHYENFFKAVAYLIANFFFVPEVISSLVKNAFLLIGSYSQISLITFPWRMLEVQSAERL